jgi:hypothetical protein
MALFENAAEGLLEGGAATGLAIGVGAVLLVPGLLPALGRAARAVAVGVIKTGMMVYDQTVPAMRETTGDLVAEARTQLDADRQRNTAGLAHGHAEAHG